MNRLVVAHHQEDIGWLDQLPEGWEPFVVEKGRDLPNEGREPASFLWAMQRLRPIGTLAFVQGNPFPHDAGLIGHLQEPVTKFRWLPEGNHDSSVDGHPHHGGLRVADRCAEWFGAGFTGTIRFAAGGQFAIPGWYLLRHPKVFYERLQEAACVGEDAWVFERAWERMWL